MARQLAVLRERARTDRELLEVFCFVYLDIPIVELWRVPAISFSLYLDKKISAYPWMYQYGRIAVLGSFSLWYPLI